MRNSSNEESDTVNLEVVLERLRAHAAQENIRVTQHAQQEMVEEEINLSEALEANAKGQILENYPEHRRGAWCRVNGTTQQGRPVHVVCTTAQPMLIIITVYEPKTPKWVTATERGRKG